MSSIKLKHSGGNAVSLNPPTSAPTSSEISFKLPNADGSAGQLLKTDGSGNLGWATDQGGKILEVVSTYNTTHISTTSTSFVDSGISATITPSSSSSKILIQSTFNVGANSSGTVYFKLYNGSSEITAATNGNSSNGSAFTAAINHAFGLSLFTIGQVGHNFLYTSNTTSPTTIKVYWRCDGGTAYINRYGYSTDVGGGSCLTLMEVAV